MESKQPCVLILGPHAPTLISFRGHLISRLVEEGCKVVAVAGEFTAELEAKVRALGAEPRALDTKRKSINPLSNLAYERRIAKLVAEIRPDCMFSYTPKSAIWGSIAAARHKVPRISAMLSGLGIAFTDGPGLKRMITRRAQTVLYRRALSECHTVFFQNPDDRELFEGLGLVKRGSSILVNGSGVDVDHYAVAAMPAQPAFLMAARLNVAKGVREYCNAAVSLKIEYPDARFLLAGWIDETIDAISEKELQGWIAGGVEYLGKLDDMRVGLRQASVFVLPSFYREGVPRAALEAMAMGRPIITTDSPGCRETVREGLNGWLVPPRDTAALRAAMKRFIQEPGLVAEMGEHSRRYACERFDVRAVSNAIIAGLGL